jgi:hypothetical protein
MLNGLDDEAGLPSIKEINVATKKGSKSRRKKGGKKSLKRKKIKRKSKIPR